MTQVDWTAVVDVLEAIAWPLLVGIAVFLLRDSVLAIVTSLSGRVSRVSVAGISLEIGPAPEIRPTWTMGADDLRSATGAMVFDSGSGSLFTELAKGAGADYAVIDLGRGQSWLSSRLFLFAEILGAVSGVRRFVFVCEKEGVKNVFVGMIPPQEISTALAQAYPWLEASYLSARAPDAGVPQTGVPIELGELARKNPEEVSGVARQFLEAIQSSVQPSPEDEAEWVGLSSMPGQWEHGKWLFADEVTRMLGMDVASQSFVYSLDTAPEDILRAVLRRTGAFTARINDAGQFVNLVDRTALLERIAGQHAFDQ